MLNTRLEGLRDYPFQRLGALIADQPPRVNVKPIDLSVGEPRHQPPAFVAQIVAEHKDSWNRYPPLAGSPDFRAACAKWLTRRYALPVGMIEGETMIAPCAGTREGLYMAAALGLNGDLDEARVTLAEGIRIKPEVNSLAAWQIYRPWETNPEYLALRAKTLDAGLHRASFPGE